MEYNPQIHNRRSIRLKHYDYSNEGAYFITICCNGRKCLFGNITNGEMILNANGNIAYNEWLKTTDIRSIVELDVFVIMPNHIHGIIIINNQMVVTGRGVLHTPSLGMNECVNKPNVFYSPGQHPTSESLRLPVIRQGVCNTPLRSQSNNIGAIVRGYKSAVTKQMNILNSSKYDQSSKVWQRNYYEHIIHNEQSYQNIADYIINNPSKWNADRYR